MAWTLLVGMLLTAFVDWWWIDSLIALVLVYFVVKEGLEAVRHACRDLQALTVHL